MPVAGEASASGEPASNNKKVSVIATVVSCCNVALLLAGVRCCDRRHALLHILVNRPLVAQRYQLLGNGWVQSHGGIQLVFGDASSNSYG